MSKKRWLILGVSLVGVGFLAKKLAPVAADVYMLFKITKKSPGSHTIE